MHSPGQYSWLSDRWWGGLFVSFWNHSHNMMKNGNGARYFDRNQEPAPLFLHILLKFQLINSSKKKNRYPRKTPQNLLINCFQLLRKCFKVSENSRSNLAREELRCRTSSLVTVRQVCSSDDKCTITNKISGCAEHVKPIRGVVGNTTAILLVLGVAEQNRTNNLVAYSGTRIRQSGSYEGRSLPIIMVSFRNKLPRGRYDLRVSSAHNLGVGTFRTGQVQETYTFGNGCCRSTSRIEVAGKSRTIRTSDALDPDV